MRPSLTARSDGRPGYVLVVVLLVVTVLSLAAYRFADAMADEYTVAVRSTEMAQARTFAVSGVHYAAGALADPATVSGTLGGNPGDAPAAFAGVTVGPTDAPRGGGRFTLFTVGDTFTGSGEGRYQARNGATDEAGKLNVNALIQLDPTGQVLHDALMKLPNMTEDVADAVVDWLDSDDTQRTNGAESAYYTGLGTPYRCKNGPANTVDELLLVRGVTPALLFGNDRNRNGRMDPGESDGSDFNRGWSEFLTVYGRELDVDADGNPRISLSDTEADPATLSADLTTAVGQVMSDYLLFSMMGGSTSTISTGSSGSTSSGSGSSSGSSGSTSSGQSSSSSTTTQAAAATGSADDLAAAVQSMIAAGKTISKPPKSVLALVNTQATLPKPQGAAASAAAPVFPCPLNDPATLNSLLPTLLDATTTRTTFELTPRVNVNTAPPEVLAALPGLSADDVTAVTAARGTTAADDLATLTGAWLVTAANVSPATFQKVEPYVTGRSMTYRVQSVGYFAQGGPTARVEAVIDTNQGRPRILYFRDLTDLGRGFDLPR